MCTRTLTQFSLKLFEFTSLLHILLSSLIITHYLCKLQLVLVKNVPVIINNNNLIMAASNVGNKREKVFTFKKRDASVEKVVFLDDDDDDFKPSKHPFNGKLTATVGTCNKGKPGASNSQQKVSSKKGISIRKVATSSSSTVKEIKCAVSGDVNERNESSNELLVEGVEEEELQLGTRAEGEVGVVNGKKEIEEILLLDELENYDLETVGTSMTSPGPSSSNDGKQAWKNLMSQMQKNQKGDSSDSKKGKVSAKRTLVKSPVKPKATAALLRRNDQIQSPIKKNARLCGDGKDAAAASSSALKESSSQESNLSSHKSSAPIAPIFLPPAERKALQKSSSVKGDANHLLESIIDSNADYESENNNIPEDPTHFSGNVVILNHNQPDKDPYEGNKTKVCPFYKKLPGVPFCVDAFNYGLIPGMEVYFLSHFHSDHYIGLTKKFCKTIICTYPTGNLVRMKLYVEEKCIRKLHINKPYLICDSEVTLVDANHCPGSVMFIFRFKNGSVTLQFPTQIESVANVVSHVKRHLEHRPQTLLICGSYMIGKERVYFTLAEAIGSKVFLTYDKRKIINALENKKFSSLLSADENSTQIHVVPMFSISAKNLQEYLAKYPQYTNIIGIKPSGWQFSSCGSGCSVKTYYNGTVTLLGVPYSEHSSYSELKEFVTTLKPKRVQPTVNVGNAKKRQEMMQYIESWLS